MKQARVRVSIVIPAYNEERHLKVSLQAISNQTQAPFEVIVVDNNSTDATVDIARQFPFVTIVQEAQKGIVYARNAGFNAATGDIIGRIDADTLLPNDWVQQVQDFYALPANKQRSLTGGCQFYNLRTGWLTGHGYNFFVHRSNRLFLGYYLPWGSNMALPRAVWKDIKNYTCLRTDVHEDIDLGLHLHNQGYQVVYLPWLRVKAVARRIMSDHQLLWPYMLMWPRTFRAHGIPHIRSCCALLTAIIVWAGSYGVYVTESIARSIAGRPTDY